MRAWQLAGSAAAKVADRGPRRLLRAMSANAMAQAVAPIAQFALVPVFLVHWGADRYGQWLMLGAIPSAIALADLGLGAAAANALVMLVARDRHDEAARLNSGLLGLCCMAGLGAVSLAVVAGACGPSFARVHAMSLALLAVYGVLALLADVATVPLNALQRYPLRVHAGTLLRIADLAVTLAVVCSAGSLDMLCGALACTRLVGLAVVWAIVRRAAPWLRRGPSLAALPALRPLLPDGLAFLAFPALNALFNQGVLLVIGLSLDAASVARFGILRSALRWISQCLNVVILSVQPEVTLAHAQGDEAHVRALSLRAQLTVIPLGLGLSVALGFAAPWLLPWWTARAIAIDLPLLWMLVAVQAVAGVWVASSIVLVATQRHRRMGVRSLIAASLAVVLCAGAAAWGGLRAVAGVLLCVEVAMAWGTLREASRTIGVPLRTMLAVHRRG